MFHIAFLKQSNYRNGEQTSGCQRFGVEAGGGRREVGAVTQGQREAFCGDGDILYLDFTGVLVGR